MCGKSKHPLTGCAGVHYDVKSSVLPGHETLNFRRDMPLELHRAVTALQPHYFLTVQDVALMLAASQVYVADHLQVRHQSPVVRAVFPTAEESFRLTVPIHPPHHGATIAETLLDTRQPWPRRHLKSLYHQYRFAPYFDVYYTVLEQVFSHVPHHLGDFLYGLTQAMCRRLFPDKPLERFSAMGIRTREEVIQWLREQNNPPLLCAPGELPYYRKYFAAFPLYVVQITEPIPVGQAVQLAAHSPLIVGLFFQGPAFLKTIEAHLTVTAAESE